VDRPPEMVLCVGLPMGTSHSFPRLGGTWAEIDSSEPNGGGRRFQVCAGQAVSEGVFGFTT
jgi:hypothetical protein